MQSRLRNLVKPLASIDEVDDGVGGVGVVFICVGKTSQDDFAAVYFNEVIEFTNMGDPVDALFSMPRPPNHDFPAESTGEALAEVLFREA